LAEIFDLNDTAQQAEESLKRAANTAARPFRQLARNAARRTGRKAARGLLRAGKKAGKLAIQAIKAFVQAVIKLMATLGPWALVILLAIIIFAAAFGYMKDERGSSSQMTLDPSHENPTVMTDEGYLKATAMTESQALIDAYYKYLSCDSFQKVYVDDSGTIHRYNFSNVTQTADFAGLTDLYNKENYFYLSSYFLKMTDELFNNGEFYYPEQFIKSVHSDVLPIKNASGDEAGKKYVTTLPLVDNGSDNAAALLAKLTGTPADGPYAVPPNAGGGTASGGTEGTELPKRKVPDSATLNLIAQSKAYEKSVVSILDDSGSTYTVDGYDHQGSTDVLGVWDYGFGSVLQYEPMTKDQSINVSKISFTYHYHVTPWTKGMDTEGNSVHVLDFDPDTCCRQATYEINLSSDTAASILNKIKAIVNAAASDNGNSGVEATLIACPTKDQIEFMLSHRNNIKTAISPEDEELAGVYFDDPALQSAFGNATAPVGGGAYVKATHYPLKVPVICAAATFSGNIRYKYSMSTLTNDLMDETSSTSSIQSAWGEDCSTIKYKTFTCGDKTRTCTVDRAGTLTTTQPAAAASGEYTDPMGFEYIEDYGDHYRAYVPNRVRKDMDFRERVYEKQEGADALNDTEKASYDVDQDGEVTVMDFLIKIGLLTPYSEGLLGQTGGITQGEISAEDQADMASLGCGMDEEGQVRLLAKVIGAEAGPNKLDQLLVGAVVVNRVYSAEFSYADSIIEVIKAPNQYASWSNGSIASIEPTEEMISSARQILNGEFAIPANIVFQAAFAQGNTTWLINVNGPSYYTHYYCCNGTPQATDIFGRTALTEAQARDLAEQLHQQDVANGAANGGAGSGIAASPVGSSTIIEDGVWNGQKLYANENFNLQKALSTMKQVSSRDGLGFLETLYAIGSAIADVFEQISKFISITGSIFGTKGELVELYAATVDLTDIRDTIVQAVTFSNQDIYSTVADEFDPEVLQFLFVGESGWAGAVQGTTGFGGGSFIPGTGSTLSGFNSPTASHYGTISPWTSASGNATIAIPSGTPVLAVGDTKVTGVTDTDGKYKVVMTGTADGKDLSITYENLASVNVAVGDSLLKGDTVGIAGDGGMTMTLIVDGVNVDPMSYFYQPAFGSGASFYNVLDANGMIDQTKVDELSALINSANVRTNGPYDKWHDTSFNTRSVGQCTWWAWGRGYQYCEENNSMPSGSFGANGGTGYGNGVDYYSQAAEDFAVGQIAAPNSWISWAWTSPDSSGNWYGHVAFVEAVGADGTILISDCGSSIWKNGPGIRLKTVRNTGTAAKPNYSLGSKYRFVGFVYLSQPK